MIMMSDFFNRFDSEKFINANERILKMSNNSLDISKQEILKDQL